MCNGAKYSNIDPELKNTGELNSYNGRPSLEFVSNEQKESFIKNLGNNLELTEANTEKYFSTISNWWETSEKFTSSEVVPHVVPKPLHLPTSSLDKDIRFSSKLKFSFGEEIDQLLESIRKARSLQKLGLISTIEMVMAYGGAALFVAGVIIDMAVFVFTVRDQIAICKGVKDEEGNIQAVEQARCDRATENMAITAGFPGCLGFGALNIGLGLGCAVAFGAVSIFMNLLPQPSFSLHGPITNNPYKFEEIKGDCWNDQGSVGIAVKYNNTETLSGKQYAIEHAWNYKFYFFDDMTSEQEDECDGMYSWFRNTECNACQIKIDRLRHTSKDFRDNLSLCQKYHQIFEDNNSNQRLTDICFSICDNHDNFRPDSWLEENDKKEIKPLALPSTHKQLQQVLTRQDGSFNLICVRNRNEQIIAEDRDYVYFKKADGYEERIKKYQRRFQYNDAVRVGNNNETVLTLQPYINGKKTKYKSFLGFIPNTLLPTRHFKFRLQTEGVEKKVKDVGFKGHCKIYRKYEAPACSWGDWFLRRCPGEPVGWEDKGTITWTECDSICHNIKKIIPQPPIRGVAIPPQYYHYCRKFTFEGIENPV
eukprot:Pgem_evm1s13227